jgi:F420-dependent oxidoreductase-like protein
MRLCLMIEGQEGVTWPQWVALAHACERAGLEGLFRSDHYFSVAGRGGRGSLDALTTLAGLAECTSRIRLGTMVSPATFRHPSVTASATTTIDHISGGRAELGLGAGWYEREHAAFGFPFPPLGARMEMFEEQAEVIVRQWTEPSFSYAGKHLHLTDCEALPKPLQQPHPPLIVGGSGKPRTVAVAVRLAQEYNVVFPTVAECRALRGRLDEACERAGRDPESIVLSVMTTCLVAADEDDLVRRAQLVADRGEGGDGAALLAENRDTWVCGTVARAAERLAELREAGVERMMLQHLLHEDVEAVDVLGTELAAALA